MSHNGEFGAVEYRIALALREGLPDHSVRMGFQIVGGMSVLTMHLLKAALDYLSSSGVPVDCMKKEDFEVYLTNEDKVLLNIDSCSTRCNPVINGAKDENVWTLFHGLCTKLFRDANHLLNDLTPLYNSIERDKSLNPRRGLIWRRSPREIASVASVAQQYQGYLRILSAVAPTLPVFKAERQAGPLGHRCPSYVQEEVILTSHISHNAIISH
ncbi:hypothetical protein D9758_002274 [Tetrapyrgos nigripes]|uniref:Uncharacterized protein n=1 Tax=Tetrapyrgos nigripes TaxID=182062 RepID=A0A8H5LSZ9_9AGAR|nr:hypothetical protein D9758_002274 [Tetrapyrgos nigripes]